ncbi:ankyrin repeat domain-containing protein [Vibrio crassostreae]|uniref:ankyrin repeat domain-containing protein n=1 Tax=Vibrio crassostreae TaxID=246167 RepID=UPI001B315413|nr:ankyrin repeat domain-containing protein [Vibrio crassostreae]
MVRKLIVAILCTIPLTSFAFTDEEVMKVIKDKNPSDDVMGYFSNPDFNPYRKINGVPIAELAERYGNEKIELALRVNKERVEKKSNTVRLDNIDLGTKFEINVFNLVIASGDTDAFARYTSKHSPTKEQVNQKDANDLSPLMTAVLTSGLEGNPVTIDKLVKLGANVDEGSGSDGNSPLLESCKRDSVVNMLSLMKNGASIYTNNNSGEDLLQISRKNNSNLCKVIIKEILNFNDQ